MITDISNRSAQRRITVSLFTTESLFSAAFIASLTLLSINAVELSGSDAMAGVPSTVALIGRAAFAIPIGWLMDRLGRRPILVFGYLLGVLGLMVSGLAIGWVSFLVLCLGAGIAGMANGTSQQTRYVASEVWPQQQRARVIGFIVFAGTVGAIFGPLLAATMVDVAASLGLPPNAGPYYAGALLAAAAALLAFLLLRPDPIRLSKLQDEAARSVSGDPIMHRQMREIFAQPMVQLAVASMVIGQLVMTLIMVITPVHMHHLNHSTGEISLVFTAHTLGMFGFAAVTGWLIDHLGTRPMMAYGAAILIVASVLTPMAGTVAALALALFLLGLGWNFCFVAGSALLSSQLHYSERGQVQGANDTLVALASGAGSLITGTIFATSGIMGVGAVGLALTLMLAVFATLRGRRQPTAQVVEGVSTPPR